jgi:hypothetical protein
MYIATALTTDLLIKNEKSLQSIISENYGLKTYACRVYFIQDEDNVRTGGLTRDAIGKIVIREMRVSSRRPFNHVNYQEHVSRVYIWPDFQTTKLPDEYSDAILYWFNEIKTTFLGY